MSDRTRKSVFGSAKGNVDTKEQSEGLDLNGFQPTPAPNVDVEKLQEVAKASGFNTRHSSEKGNQPKKVDGRTLRKSPRTKQFHTRLRPETHAKFFEKLTIHGSENVDEFLSHLIGLYEMREE